METAIPRPAGSAIAADLILFGGSVLTLDRLGRRGSSVAVRNGLVAEVGEDRDVLRLAGERTRLVDLAGRAALPGFIETHSHPMGAGAMLRQDVDASTPPNVTIDDVLQRVAAAVARKPDGAWVRGGRYDDTLLRDMRHPTRWDLDRVAPDHPVYLSHVSGHLGAANSVALRLAGVTRETPDPAGGVIFRDDRGEPTGVFAETAQRLVTRLFPPATLETMVENLAAAGESYAATGITSLTDAGQPAEGVAAYRRAVATGELRLRAFVFVSEQTFADVGRGMLPPIAGVLPGLGDDRFRVGCAKLLQDGSIQGLTGALTRPYTCAPETRGVLIYPQPELETRVRAFHDGGWQIAIHGNGDAAIDSILDAYEAAQRANPRADHRHRIEHLQMAREDQLERMAELGIHASIFVKHVYYWGDRHRDRFIGPERAARISPLRSAERLGIRFALHSDCPVTPVAPLEAIWTAVNRITRDGKVLGPEQRVGVERALRAYTSDAAYLSFEEDRKGTLEPGKLGDIVILSADPLTMDPEALNQLRVETTVVGGEVVWQA